MGYFLPQDPDMVGHRKRALNVLRLYYPALPLQDDSLSSLPSSRATTTPPDDYPCPRHPPATEAPYPERRGGLAPPASPRLVPTRRSLINGSVPPLGFLPAPFDDGASARPLARGPAPIQSMNSPPSLDAGLDLLQRFQESTFSAADPDLARYTTGFCTGAGSATPSTATDPVTTSTSARSQSSPCREQHRASTTPFGPPSISAAPSPSLSLFPTQPRQPPRSLPHTSAPNPNLIPQRPHHHPHHLRCHGHQSPTPGQSGRYSHQDPALSNLLDANQRRILAVSTRQPPGAVVNRTTDNLGTSVAAAAPSETSATMPPPPPRPLKRRADRAPAELPLSVFEFDSDSDSDSDSGSDSGSDFDFDDRFGFGCDDEKRGPEEQGGGGGGGAGEAGESHCSPRGSRRWREERWGSRAGSVQVFD